MKIAKRQLRRIISEVVSESQRQGNIDSYRRERRASSVDPRVLDIEGLIYSGDYDLADADLQALGQSLPFLRGHNPAVAKEMEKEYDRLSDLLSTARRKQ